MAKETAHEIDRAAAAWASRADRGLTAREEAKLETWLAGDVRRRGAYAKARAVALHTERARALGSAYDPRTFQARGAVPVASRRKLLAYGGAVAAGLAGALGVKLSQTAERFSTGRGELRVVPLADGSVVTLNTDSVILVRYTSDRREIRLLRGEALFEVAKAPSRPFVVKADEAEAAAVGTSFSVSRIDDAPVQVLVREGVVQVRRLDDATTVPPLRLSANTRAIVRGVKPGFRIAAAPNDEVERDLAWRDGRIVLQGETLRHAATRFARYSDTRIVFEDASIGEEEVTGLYRANDPVGFAEAVATAFDLRVEVGAGEVRLRR